MTRWDAEIHTVLRDVLALSKDHPFSDETRAEDVLGWDSLAWITIVNRLQEKLQIELPLDEIADFETIGDIRRSIERHVGR